MNAPAVFTLPPSWRLPAGAAVMLLIILAAYHPVTENQFLWDDHPLLVTANPYLHQSHGYVAYWRGEGFTPDYYPLHFTSLWVQYQLFGDQPRGYHLVSLFQHFLACWLLWLCLRAAGLRGDIAYVTALLFAIHPINVASVAWISEQKNTLSMIFFCAAGLAWFRFRQSHDPWLYATCIIAFALGLLSKASGIGLPLVLLAVTWWHDRKLRWRDIAAALPLIAIAVASGAGAIWFQHHRAVSDIFDPRPEGLLSRIAATGWAIWFYLRTIILPHDLAMVYPRWNVPADYFQAWVPLILLAVLLLVVAFVIRYRGLLVAWVVYLLLLGPTLGLVTMAYHQYSLVADQWHYLALPAMLVLFAIPLARYRPLVVPVMILLMGLTFMRVRVFHDDGSLFADNVARYPQCWIAHMKLGDHLFNQYLANPADEHAKEELKQAEYHMRQSLSIHPDQEGSHYRLALLLSRTDRRDEAIEYYEEELRIDPRHQLSQRNLGYNLLARGDIMAAAEHLSKAIELNPNDADAHFLLGRSLMRQGRHTDAAAQFRRALELNPADAEARQALQQAEHMD